MSLNNQLPNLLFRFGVDTNTVVGGGDTPGIVTGYNDISNVAPGGGARLWVADLGPNWMDYGIAGISFRCSGAAATTLRMTSRDTVTGADRWLPYVSQTNSTSSANTVSATSNASWAVRCNGRYLAVQLSNIDATNPLTFGAIDHCHLSVWPN